MSFIKNKVSIGISERETSIRNLLNSLIIENDLNLHCEPLRISHIENTVKNFMLKIVIGEGSFSTVYLGIDLQSNECHAIKVCDKKHIIREKKEIAIMREKQIMDILNTNPSPFVVKLFYTFEDSDSLYFVMNYAKHGDLSYYITKFGSLGEECTKFYAAEIVLGLEHLHKLNIIHRDLKPENILLNKKMHIQITDFGSAKIMQHEFNSTLSRRDSLVGTAQYVSPEMLTHKNTYPSSDLWALGCIIYQMISGLPPFRAKNEYLIFKKIIKLNYDFPNGFLNLAKDIVEKLLVLDPHQRLGASDNINYFSIRNHPFFQNILWDKLHEQVAPPILPYLPETFSNEELHNHYPVSGTVSMDNEQKPVMDNEQKSLSINLKLEKDRYRNGNTIKQSILDISPKEYDERLKAQIKENIWHKFVENNLILKYGLVKKRKKFFSRKCMLLLTTGPHLYYVDPVNMVLKGQIPWSRELRTEPKNFKTFFVHTSNRTYCLKDPDGFALKWCHDINEVHKTIYFE